MKLLITGGAGFIGSAAVRLAVEDPRNEVYVIDKMTYAASRGSIAPAEATGRVKLIVEDICNSGRIGELMKEIAPDAVLHLAAETHVDRSISGPQAFLDTNISGTANLLGAALRHWSELSGEARDKFRFIHVSTDEVYGSLGQTGKFTETTPYDPSSPYSASKAASDHLVKAWHRTYGLPVIISNCSNNYGPYHFPEKLIPLTILSAMEGRQLRVYGTGENVRDWLYVDDHARALFQLLGAGRTGETYNVGGRNERANLEVVESICDLLDRIAPGSEPYRRLITFVEDRPGHDFRYAIDATKIETEVGWQAQEGFETGLEKTIRWYLANEDWWRPIRERIYAGERLGLPAEA